LLIVLLNFKIFSLLELKILDFSRIGRIMKKSLKIAILYIIKQINTISYNVKAFNFDILQSILV